MIQSFSLAVIPTRTSFTGDIVRVGWVPIFWEVQGKSISGDLDLDNEIYEQDDRTIVVTTPLLHWLSTRAYMNWPCQQG
jgi:hypothetical protein